MGKDFKIGVIAGAILAGMALIWVATRPSLRPQPRMAPAEQPPAVAGQTLDPAARTIPNADALNTGVDGARVAPANDSAAAPVRPGGPAGKPPVPAQPVAGATQAGVPDLTIHEMSEPIKTTRFHIVRRGETLSAISQQYYGSKEKWRKILTANSKVIKDANKIAPGTKLIIPE